MIKSECSSSRVKGLSLHPQLSWVLISLHNGTINLWDYRVSALLDKYEEHEGPVRGVAFHPSQSIFVSGGDDYKVKVWKLRETKSQFTLYGHLDYVRTVEFHSELPWILSASDDQTVRLWNWQSRTNIAILAGHNHYVMCATFAKSLPLLASASLDQTVRVWDFSGLKSKWSGAQGVGSSQVMQGSSATEFFGTNDAVCKFIIDGHERGVNTVVFHPTQNMIISGADDRLIKLWRFDETKWWEVDCFRGHFNNVSALSYVASKDWVISNSEDRTIRVWDLSRRCLIHTFRRDSDRFWALASASNIVACGHDSGTVVFKLGRDRSPTSLTHIPGYGTVLVLTSPKPWAVGKATFQLVKLGQEAESLPLSKTFGTGSEVLDTDTETETATATAPAAKTGVINAPFLNIAYCRRLHIGLVTFCTHIQANPMPMPISDAEKFIPIIVVYPVIDAEPDNLEIVYVPTDWSSLARNSPNSGEASWLPEMNTSDTAMRSMAVAAVTSATWTSPTSFVAASTNTTAKGLIVGTVSRSKNSGNFDCATTTLDLDFELEPPIHRVFFAGPGKALLCYGGPAATSTLASQETSTQKPHTSAASKTFVAVVDIKTRKATSILCLASLNLGMTVANRPKHAIWNSAMSRLALISKLHVVLTDRQLNVLGVISESQRIKSGAWDEFGMFVYSTAGHVKFATVSISASDGGHGGDQSVFKGLLSSVGNSQAVPYIQMVRRGCVISADRLGGVQKVSIANAQYWLHAALAMGRRDLAACLAKSSYLANHAYDTVALEKAGFSAAALGHPDPRERFRAAYQSADIPVAITASGDLTSKTEAAAAKRLLSSLAMQWGQFSVAEQCLQRTKDFTKLTQLYAITGDRAKLGKLGQACRLRLDTRTSYHIAALSGNVELQIEMLREWQQTSLALSLAHIHKLEDLEKDIASQMSPELVAKVLSELPATPRLFAPPIPVTISKFSAGLGAGLDWPLKTIETTLQRRGQEVLGSAAGPVSLGAVEDELVKMARNFKEVELL